MTRKCHKWTRPSTAPRSPRRASRARRSGTARSSGRRHRLVQEAEPAPPARQPRHARRRDRRRRHDVHVPRRSSSAAATEPKFFTAAVAVWLWFTVLFANFAEAMAEGRGKAQANTLRAMKRDTMAQARARRRASSRSRRPSCGWATSSASRRATTSPATATSSKASPTSARPRSPASPRPCSRSRAPTSAAPSPAARRSSATGCASASRPTRARRFLDRMIALVEGASRQKTPNEIALNILLATFTIIFLLAVGTIRPVRQLPRRRRHDDGARRAARLPDPDDHRRPAVGDRHRRHGPHGAAQRARDVRQGGRDGRRHRHAAARQDGHDHLRQPPRGGVHPRGRPQREGGRRWRRCSRRSPTRRRKASRSSTSRDSMGYESGVADPSSAS